MLGACWRSVSNDKAPALKLEVSFVFMCCSLSLSRPPALGRFALMCGSPARRRATPVKVQQESFPFTSARPRTGSEWKMTKEKEAKANSLPQTHETRKVLRCEITASTRFHPCPKAGRVSTGREVSRVSKPFYGRICERGADSSGH